MLFIFGPRGLNLVEKIILPGVLFFVTFFLASVRITVPTSAKACCTVIGSCPLATKYAIYSLDLLSYSMSVEQILLKRRATPFWIPFIEDF